MRFSIATIPLLFLPVAAADAQPGRGELEIYFIDTEGGQSTLFVSPAGESLLVDTGNAGERDLVRIVGRKEEPGRPILYGTTVQFLEFFNLRSLRDMPDLHEFREIGSLTEVQSEHRLLVLQQQTGMYCSESSQNRPRRLQPILVESLPVQPSMNIATFETV